MFTNKTKEGRNNLCGEVIRNRRIEMGKSQRQLADMLQIAGLDIDKNAVQRIESGKRFVTDIELTYVAKVLKLSYQMLLDSTNSEK
ncbi:MAG: helix-turn-helix transcriptional regulator [Ruminococcaceae bacterium]|nr:helix-turn-helix transcriptional regulator [Oscillospiraceae bacterium]